ncbi:ROK family protein [Amycolatopsis sp. OK19-0408]|uniref:ROK family protein n=1 Tax=Amycolatopsis iheyensis TaxID=2945988 RepID=A0A9X2SM77_9PSEU|nr:ROK family protein [Amycolatopsis iheyensis]MCR6487522.1 ROK family protein [Amycolatopsis iheyensis]
MSTGERPALRLVPAPVAADAGPVPGAVELLPGRVRAALLDLSGAVLWRAEATYPSGTTDQAAIDAALEQVTRFPTPPTAVGVAAAGLVDAEAGVIIEVNEVPALHGYPVADVLAKLVHAPVHVEHRARLQVLGDRWFGEGRGRTTFASVSTGEVLGVGLLYDGEVLAPPGGRSGAHMTVAASGLPCTCGARGCWKTVATTPWLRAEAERRGLEARAVRDLAGDPLLDEYAANIALGLVNIQQLFAPGLFVLHGEAAEGGERFRARIEQRLREDSSWARSAEPPRVVVHPGPADDVALLGGAGLVLSRR